jgi:hypothetical protein
MISKPVEAVKAQVSYQEEFHKKAMLFIESKINEHLNKYPDEEGLHKILIPMAEYKDFIWFWHDGLQEAIEKCVLDAGWKIPTSKEAEKEVYQLKYVTGPAISLHLSLEASDEELERLDEIREKTKAEFHRVKNMRQKHGI